MNGEIISVVQMIEKMIETKTSSRICSALAKIIREFYVSLIKEGFAKDEAVRIVCSVGSSFKAS
jgi:hypothetical protein